MPLIPPPQQVSVLLGCDSVLVHGDTHPHFATQNLTLKGQPTMFRAVKGKTPREQETPQNWDWDAISPKP